MMVHGYLVALLRGHTQAAQEVAMHGNTIGVEIRCRHREQNGFLLHPGQSFLGKQDPAHCF